MTFFDFMATAGDIILAMLMFILKFTGCLCLIALVLICFVILFLALVGFCAWIYEQMENHWRSRNTSVWGRKWEE